MPLPYSDRAHRFALLAVSAGLAVLPMSASAVGPDCLLDLSDVQLTEGVTGPGAEYVFAMPDAWNGQLVTYVRGQTEAGEDPNFTDSLCVAAEVATRHGFAVAASAFSVNGFAIAEATRETHQLRGLFASEFGHPDKTFVWGKSMGGLVGEDLIEQYAPSQYDGALLECGLVGGSTEQFEHSFTAGVLFDHFFDGALGYDLTEPPSGLDEAVETQRVIDILAADLVSAAQADLGECLDQCCSYVWWLGETVCNPFCVAGSDIDLDGSVALELARVDQSQMVVREDRLDAVLDLADEFQIPLGLSPLERDLIDTFLGHRLVPNVVEIYGQVVTGAVLNLSPELESLTQGRHAFGNMDVDYTGSEDDVAMNAGVPRVDAHPAAANALANWHTPDGDLGAPIVTLHNVVDPVVPYFHESLLQGVVQTAGADDLLVQQSVEAFGHCEFTAGELEGAFLDMVGWANDDVVPAGGDVTGRILP